MVSRHCPDALIYDIFQEPVQAEPQRYRWFLFHRHSKRVHSDGKAEKPSLSELGPVADRSAWNAGANCVQVAVIAG
jgi:hypothetical protein